MNSPNGAQSVAIIGAGIAGLGAAWALSRRHRVTLYERDSRFGGHAHTVVARVEDNEISVDTGFIVYNERNYPHLIALFDTLQVATATSDMSFGVSVDGGALEYSGSDLRALFAQPLNSLRPRFWRMLKDIARFYRKAESYRDAAGAGMSIGELLTREAYSDAFVEDHLIPMAAAIWSASRDDIRHYPAARFIDFFANHGLLSLTDRPQWRTVIGGSQEYVRRLLDASPIERAPSSRIATVRRHSHGVDLVMEDGQARAFDQVVLATHADQALALLENPSADERQVLGSFRYSRNATWLHRDPRLMPRRRRAWSAWNYLQHSSRAGHVPLSVSYWMNRLQPLPTKHQLFVTLNPVHDPLPELVHGRFDYDHPVFNEATARAQAESAVIQGTDNTWFCGSYLGHGFHEDALQSGLWVAEQLGAAPPWAHGYDRLPAGFSTRTPRAA